MKSYRNDLATFHNSELLLKEIQEYLPKYKILEKECQKLLAHNLVMPAYEQCVKANHCFNLLDARGVISVTERAGYIARVRALAKACCQAWCDSLEENA